MKILDKLFGDGEPDKVALPPARPPPLPPPRPAARPADGHAYALMQLMEKQMTDEPKANDLQVGGDHYKQLDPEPWDVICAWGLGYLDGNAIKYIARARARNGIEDLKKAQHYLSKLIETLDASFAAQAELDRARQEAALQRAEAVATADLKDLAKNLAPAIAEKAGAPPAFLKPAPKPDLEEVQKEIAGKLKAAK